MWAIWLRISTSHPAATLRRPTMAALTIWFWWYYHYVLWNNYFWHKRLKLDIFYQPTMKSWNNVKSYREVTGITIGMYVYEFLFSETRIQNYDQHYVLALTFCMKQLVIYLAKTKYSAIIISLCIFSLSAFAWSLPIFLLCCSAEINDCNCSYKLFNLNNYWPPRSQP